MEHEGASEAATSDCFDEITLTESALTKQSFEEGVQDGLVRGCHEGYELGYIEGLALGKELAEYFSLAVVHLHLAKHDKKLEAALMRLVSAIREFPFENEPSIIERKEKIRLLYRLLRSSGLKQTTKPVDKADEKLSF